MKKKLQSISELLEGQTFALELTHKGKGFIIKNGLAYGNIWIERADTGEGGDFSKERLLAVIEEFYNKDF